MALSKKHSLVHENAYIEGKWLPAKSGLTFTVENPATQELLANVADLDEDDTNYAIEVANNAFQTWKTWIPKERSFVLRKLYDLVLDNKDELADIIVAENGKTKADALTEVAYGASFIEWFAEETKRIYGEYIPSSVASKRYVIVKQPAGIAGMITPWNFPLAMITRKACAAMASGCTVVLKPAEDTPLSALAIADLSQKAGIPPGVFNVVPCSRKNAPKIGKVLCTNPLIRVISFTGSTQTGKILLEQSAGTVKKVSMELGGNAPFILFESADIEVAVKGIMSSKFRCSGQTCVTPNRLLVQESLYDKFVQRFKEEISKLQLGDGSQVGTSVGPLINTAAVEKVEKICNDALQKGAKLVCGGQRFKLNDKGYFFEPTILTNITEDMVCFKSEIFGPLAPIFKFKDESEAIAIANNVSVGLAGYFYTTDIKQAWRVAEALEVGMVGINECLLSTAECPFGGVKESGLGREGGKQGLEEYVDTKYICFNAL